MQRGHDHPKWDLISHLPVACGETSLFRGRSLPLLLFKSFCKPDTTKQKVAVFKKGSTFSKRGLPQCPQQMPPWNRRLRLGTITPRRLSILLMKLTQNNINNWFQQMYLQFPGSLSSTLGVQSSMLCHWKLQVNVTGSIRTFNTSVQYRKRDLVLKNIYEHNSHSLFYGISAIALF